MAPELDFSYDVKDDVLTVEGIRYAGDLFRGMAEGGIALYQPMWITRRGDGIVYLERLPEEVRALAEKFQMRDVKVDGARFMRNVELDESIAAAVERLKERDGRKGGEDGQSH